MRIPILAALLLAVLVIASDLYICKDIRQYCRKTRRSLWLSIYGASALICWIVVAVVLIVPKKSEAVSVFVLMWVLFSILTVYIPKILYCICSLIGRCFRRNNFNRGIYVGIPLAVAAFISMWWGVLVTRHDIHTEHVDIVSDKLPQRFDGFRILQFSDAHLGTWGNDTTFVSRLVDSINSAKPDLILFTGDIVNRESSELDPFTGILSRLEAPYGVMAIHGNHDYASYREWPDPDDGNRDVARLDSLMGRVMGWKVLNNATEFVKSGNDSIVIIGVENWGEPPFNQLGDLGKSYPASNDKLHGLNDGMFKVLMTHNPEHWGQIVTGVSNIDLTLSGHTHAMQMMLKAGDWKWSPSKYRYRHWGGLYGEKAKDGNPMNLYVNIGVGEVGFPARFGAAKPELTVFNLRRPE